MLDNSALPSAVSSTFLRVRLLVVPDMHIEPCDWVVTEGQGRPAQVRQNPMIRANHNASCIEGIFDSLFCAAVLLRHCAEKTQMQDNVGPKSSDYHARQEATFSGLKDREDSHTDGQARRRRH